MLRHTGHCVQMSTGQLHNLQGLWGGCNARAAELPVVQATWSITEACWARTWRSTWPPSRTSTPTRSSCGGSAAAAARRQRMRVEQGQRSHQVIHRRRACTSQPGRQTQAPAAQRAAPAFPRRRQGFTRRKAWRQRERAFRQRRRGRRRTPNTCRRRYSQRLAARSCPCPGRRTRRRLGAGTLHTSAPAAAGPRAWTSSTRRTHMVTLADRPSVCVNIANHSKHLPQCTAHINEHQQPLHMAPYRLAATGAS